MATQEVAHSVPDLIALAERLEAAAGWDPALDQAICGAAFQDCPILTPEYSRSLDAGMALDAPELKQFGGRMAMLREAMERMFTAKAPDSALPRFLSAAFLRARAEITRLQEMA